MGILFLRRQLFHACRAACARIEKTGEGQRDKRPRPPGRPRGLSHQADRRFCFKIERLQLLRRFFFPKGTNKSDQSKTNNSSCTCNGGVPNAFLYAKNALPRPTNFTSNTPFLTGARRHLPQPDQRCNPLWTV